MTSAAGQVQRSVGSAARGATLVGAAAVSLWWISGASSWNGFPADERFGSPLAIVLLAMAVAVFVSVGRLAMADSPPSTSAVLLALAGWAAARLVMTTLYPLGGDEAYHWAWAGRLDWGYYDHPGMVAWLARLLDPAHHRLNVCARFSPWLLGSFAPFIAWALARRTNGDAALARRAALLTALIPLLAVGSFLMPMVPLNCFWSLGVLLFWRAIERNRLIDWLLAGLATGAALNCNFTAALLPASAVLFILVSPRDRHILMRPGLWLAAAAAITAFSPTIFWNATHDWITVGFNLLRRHRELRISVSSPPTYVVLLAIFLSPVIILSLLGRTSPISETIQRRDRARAYLLMMGLAPALAFLATSLVLKPRPHYAATGFIPLVIAFVWTCATGRDGDASGAPARLRLAIRIAVAACIAFYIAAVGAMLVPESISASLIRAASPQRASKSIAEIYGWPAIAGWLDGQGVRFAADSRPVIIASSYAQTSLLMFHAPSVDLAYSRDEGRIPYGQQFSLWASLRKLPVGADAIIIDAGTIADGSVGPKDWGDYFTTASTLNTAAPGLDPRLANFTIVLAKGYRGNYPVGRVESRPTSAPVRSRASQRD